MKSTLSLHRSRAFSFADGWRQTARAVLTLLVAGGCVGPALHGALPATGVAVPAFAAYDERLPLLLERWHVPGAAVAVAIDGRIVFARAYGYADAATGRLMEPDTRVRLGSISKTITAATVLRLVEQGRLAIGERAFPLLGWTTPVYVGAVRDPRLDQITVGQLLSHTAGWNARLAQIPTTGGLLGFDPVYLQRAIAEFFALPPPASAETIARAMVGQPLQAAPGTAYSYANIDYVVLARLIEKITGASYESAVQQMLAEAGISGLQIGGGRLSDLAEDETAYHDHPGAALVPSEFGGAAPVPAPYAHALTSWDGSGGWTGSAIETLRFSLALDGAGATAGLLSPAMVAVMRAEQFPGSAYGFGWCTTNLPLSADSGHNGGLAGSFAVLTRSADGRRHTVLLLNSRPADVDAFLADIFPALHAIDGQTVVPEHDFTLTTLAWES